MAEDNVVQLGVEYRRPRIMTAAEIWASPEPSDLMIWEVCVYTRGCVNDCMGCPASEEDDGHHGPFVRGCRMLAAEACRVMMAVQRLESLPDSTTDATVPASNTR